jgi:hypothetical protein
MDKLWTRYHRRLLTAWRRTQGTMTQEQRERLAHWRRRQVRADLDAVLGAQPDAIWCVVANVVDERPYGPGGIEVRRGTRLFASGTKVSCFPPLWGDGYERVKVVGRHRRTHRYITTTVRSAWLMNWRVKLVYSPHVIREMLRGVQAYYGDARTFEEIRTRRQTWDGTPASRERADVLV